jgi:hypothetical protein
MIGSQSGIFYQVNRDPENIRFNCNNIPDFNRKISRFLDGA